MGAPWVIWLASLLILPQVLPQAAWAAQCLVVSGIEEDENGTFSGDGLLLRHGLGRCKVFDSWDELRLHVLGRGKIGPKVKKGESLFILQGAHGDLEGRVMCNAGLVSGDRVYEILREVAERNPTTAHFETCFSGDLLRKKLIYDRLHPQSASIDQLCMITSSQFNRLSLGTRYGIPLGIATPSIGLTTLQIATMREDVTGEKLFGVMKMGLISSAAWESSGITDYLIQKDLKNAAKILAWIRDAGNRSNDEISCRSGERIADLNSSHYAEVDRAMESLAKKVDRDSVSAWLASLEASLKEPGAASSKLRRHRMAREYIPILKGFLDQDASAAIDVSSLWLRLAQAPNEGWVAFHQDAPQLSLELWSPAIEAPIAVKEAFRNYGDAVRTVSKSAGLDMADLEVMKLLPQVLTPESREKIKSGYGVESILGDSLTLFNSPSKDALLNNAVSPESAMNGFVRGSLTLPKFDSPIDERRRQACRRPFLKD